MTFLFGTYSSNANFTIGERISYIIITFIITFMVQMASLKVDNHEGQLLRRLLNYNLRSLFEETLSKIGY